ncbi:hypothetical protein L596_012930 [Steinernema carpocapsae]|uniref:Uncharacterized protein n=1 Tax=Steinernema carpocapsae TaxID=34508 RepID=A0A4U5NYV8_STECR|nr:hypothetical protein L596_012930 [Steinernema carpocapsae]
MASYGAFRLNSCVLCISNIYIPFFEHCSVKLRFSGDSKKGLARQEDGGMSGSPSASGKVICNQIVCANRSDHLFTTMPRFSRDELVEIRTLDLKRWKSGTNAAAGTGI